MAISTYNGMRSKMAAPYFRSWTNKTNQPNGYTQSLWTAASSFPSVGVAPTTPVVPTNLTAGSAGQFDSSGTMRSPGWSRFQAGGPSMILLCDRLSHQAGLSGTVTSEQTTNLDTAALTRQTSGVGVMMAAEIYSAVGTTGTTISARYTNSGNTGSRNSPGRTFGGTNFREATQILPLPLLGADLGVKSVQGVTVLASTGTAGNFGITLFKPLMCWSTLSTVGMSNVRQFVLDFAQACPQIVAGACLFYMMLNRDTTIASFSGSLLFTED